MLNNAETWHIIQYALTLPSWGSSHHGGVIYLLGLCAEALFCDGMTRWLVTRERARSYSYLHSRLHPDLWEWMASQSRRPNNRKTDDITDLYFLADVYLKAAALWRNLYFEPSASLWKTTALLLARVLSLSGRTKGKEIMNYRWMEMVSIPGCKLPGGGKKKNI